MSVTPVNEALALASALGYGIVSAIVPLVNSEVYIVGAVAVLPKALHVPVLVVFTIGTVIGKGVVFLGAERVARRASAKMRARIERVASLLRGRPVATWPIVFVSACVGIPPVYAVTIAGGILRISFAGFLVACGLGRLARFAALLYGATWIWR